MSGNFFKKIEKNGKRGILALAKLLFPPRKTPPVSLAEIRKLLIFRLDGRIGNGLMLLPLANAIRKTAPAVHTEILINRTVANFFKAFSDGQFSRIIPYDQHYLLSRPWKFLTFILHLRKEKYDVVLNSTNPDSFSVSQAIFARIIGAETLAGFKTPKSTGFYDVEVASSVEKHYSDAMVDLWRYFVPGAPLIFGGLKLPGIRTISRAVFWLGATGGKHLSQTVVDIITGELKQITGLEADFAAGPADEWLLKDYRKEIREKTKILKGTLEESALYLRQYVLFISTDTGPMHLAAAIGMPTFTVFTKKSHIQYGYHDDIQHFSYYIPPEKTGVEVKEKAAFAFKRLKHIFSTTQTESSE